MSGTSTIPCSAHQSMGPAADFKPGRYARTVLQHLSTPITVYFPVILPGSLHPESPDVCYSSFCLHWNSLCLVFS